MSDRFSDRIKAGERLAASDVNEIRKSLKTRTAATDVYDLLRALAASVPPTEPDVQIAEEVLREREDSYSVKGAIWALCHHWGMTAAYTIDLLDVAQPENWRTMSDAGIAALSELGWREQDKSLYRDLLNLLRKDGELEDTGSDDFWPVHLECVVAALDQGLRGSDAYTDAMEIRSFQDIPNEFLQQIELKARLH